MEVLYTAEKHEYLASGRETHRKEKLLNRFKDDGFYLVDLLDHPLTMLPGDLMPVKEEFLERVSSLVTADTRIILVKANVYDLAYRWLAESGYKNVIDKRIHFPASGGQAKFRLQFREALELAGYR
jgi:hypothetical protein